ncbi:hypothetical protein [Cellulomonas sp. SG140]|uniref:hypothetical protein n=1 Tax=Cellulomonas sp. SG140 TaxID=2976536 RepID=UPI0021E74565|nr:hypothetical protein [Cellulomonas sp. SG140]
MIPSVLATTEPRRTLRAAALALRGWTPRQSGAAVLLTLAFAVLLGVPTVLIPNPVFGREVPPQTWSYITWVLSSVLAGLLGATYVRPSAPRRGGGRAAQASPEVPESAVVAMQAAATADRPSRWGMAGGVLTWFAVGCPVCNKIALLALGYAGTMRWFAPAQPVLAMAAVAMTAGALVVRLRGQVLCRVTTHPVGPVPAVTGTE